MEKSTGVIEAWRDDSGVRRFTNRGAPEGARVTSRVAEIQPSGVADILDTLPDPESYDVAGNTMRDFARYKQEAFRHTFGNAVADERQLTPEQAQHWRGNLNQLYAMVHGQHSGKKAAMAKKYERAMAQRDAHLAGQAKAAEANRPKNAEDFFRQTAETLIELKRKMADPTASAAELMAAEAQYNATMPRALLYESLLMTKALKPLTADEVDLIRAETETAWKAMTPAEQAQYPGGLDELESIAFARAEEIRRPPSLLARMGLVPGNQSGGAGGDQAPGGRPGVGQRGADPMVASLAPGVAAAFEKMPASQRVIVAGELDALAAQARQTGDSTALVEAMQRVAGAAPGNRHRIKADGTVVPEMDGVNIAELIKPGQGTSVSAVGRSADAAVGGIVDLLNRVFPGQASSPLPESVRGSIVSKGQRG